MLYRLPATLAEIRVLLIHTSQRYHVHVCDSEIYLN